MTDFIKEQTYTVTIDKSKVPKYYWYKELKNGPDSYTGILKAFNVYREAPAYRSYGDISKEIKTKDDLSELPKIKGKTQSAIITLNVNDKDLDFVVEQLAENGAYAGYVSSIKKVDPDVDDAQPDSTKSTSLLSKIFSRFSTVPVVKPFVRTLKQTGGKSIKKKGKKRSQKKRKTIRRK
jgi:hypothetical protein